MSKNDVEQLLAGGGWGFAKPAELSGYPGPIHVLALADKLQLSKTQVRQIKDIYTAMNRRAKQLGTAFVASERSLSTAFVSATISSARLTTLLAESGRLRMKLREVHLAAHLAMKPLLTRHQVATYSQLRGYSQRGHQHRRH